ncbi:MAG: EutP/PduV family microcompartment system protein [Clostridia bacterium]|nr:EutP/PduV family microcompartment system protein [Clostridia bacterium]
MKKILLIGTVACGKTTLCQRLNGMKQDYKKTQAVEVINHTIDTPGEYLEHRALLRNLFVTAAEVDMVLFLIDPTAERFMYSQGQSAAFPVPVIGVITKCGIATEKQIALSRELLEMTGANPIYAIDSITGEGMEPLIEALM